MPWQAEFALKIYTKTSGYRITEWLELEQTAEGHLVQHLCSSRTTLSLLPRTMLGCQAQQQCFQLYFSQKNCDKYMSEHKFSDHSLPVTFN